ncbi:MAG: hypothetical protein WD156_02070 [Acidimicrobiia bacterium]
MDIELNNDGEPVRLHLTGQEWRDCTEFDEPDWEPLERHVPESLWGEFMWMYRVRPEGRGIEAYKHRDTRRYLHLDHSNRAWQWQPDGWWDRIAISEALARSVDPRLRSARRTTQCFSR